MYKNLKGIKELNHLLLLGILVIFFVRLGSKFCMAGSSLLFAMSIIIIIIIIQIIYKLNATPFAFRGL